MSGAYAASHSLVHEAYVRLVDVDKVQHWDSRGRKLCFGRAGSRRRGLARPKVFCDKAIADMQLFFRSGKVLHSCWLCLLVPSRFRPNSIA
jgi:hypothetical protein